jgi:phosphoglycolate phosphatase
VGHGPAHLIAQTVPLGRLESNLTQYRVHHPSVMRSGTKLFPGVAEGLARLKEFGLRMAVCSNKPAIFTQELIDYLGLAPFLDAVVGPEDAPRSKPAPDLLLEAMMRLGVTPPQTLYIGDMTIDIETARGAGAAVWVVPTGSDTKENLAAARPDRLLNSFADLAPLVTANLRLPADRLKIVF